jgi:UDP-N-acetylglucosamine--N-acetylmuramyl-(pentapeptide) pyrophosphoryl-undecaprenol N-acetylglucosamine transferase
MTIEASNSGLRVMIAGGGTGGHLFPGVAIAEELRKQWPDCSVRFVGTTKGIEARVLPQLGWDHEFIEVSGLKTVGVLGALRGMLRLPKALWQARKAVKRFAPHAVIGVGGYASGPVVLMARLAGIKTAICEQNSIPGLTNKILGKFVHRVFLAFAATQSFFSAKKNALVGTPIRVPMLAKLAAAVAQPVDPTRQLRLFICGGSLGAVKLNEVVADAVTKLSENRMISVTHQTGKQGFADTKARYQQAGLVEPGVTCVEFVDDMAAQYAAADLIIARAGAATVAELAIAGKPAIFVPYPFAADNHQELNAKEIVDGGGAMMFQQSTLTGAQLAQAIVSIVDNASRRAAMAAAMTSFAKPDAGAAVAQWCGQQR